MASAKRASCTSFAVTQLTDDAPSQAKTLQTPCRTPKAGVASNANRGPVSHGAITNRGRGISRLEGILPGKSSVKKIRFLRGEVIPVFRDSAQPLRASIVPRIHLNITQSQPSLVDRSQNIVATISAGKRDFMGFPIHNDPTIDCATAHPS
jgi:hypothetical protein